MSPQTLHDQILDAADVLSDIAEREMAEALAAGQTARAERWVELAQHVAAGVRSIRPELHSAGEATHGA